MKFLYQRLMLKTSLVYFIIGIIIGFLMFLSYRFKTLEFIFYFREVHVHILLMGFYGADDNGSWFMNVSEKSF